MKKKINKIAVTFLFFISFISFISFVSYSQEFSNDKYQKTIIMDGKKSGWLEVFADPTHFGCECNDVISIDFKPTKIKNVYKSIDNTATLSFKGDSFIITIQGSKECCFVKPGKYTLLPSKF